MSCPFCKEKLLAIEKILYWNVERKEVYCSAQCMLNRHEKMRKKSCHKV